MKRWGVLFLLVFVSDVIAIPVEEEGLGGASYRPEPVKRERQSSSFATGTEDINEVEDAPSAVINANEAFGGGGGGVRRIDSSLLQPKNPSPPWWERWWDWVVGVFH